MAADRAAAPRAADPAPPGGEGEKEEKEEPSDDPFVTASFRALPPTWQQWSRELGREVTQADLRRLRGKARARRAAEAVDPLLPTVCLMLECAVDEARAASAARVAEKLRRLAAEQRLRRARARRRRDVDDPPPRGPPCLQCAAREHMRCSWEDPEAAAAGGAGAGRWRCARCARNGEAFCLRQRVDLTAEHPAGSAARERARAPGALRREVWCADPAARPAEVHARAEELLLLVRNGGRRQRVTVSGAVLAAADGAGAGAGAGGAYTAAPAPLPAWHANDTATGAGAARPMGWADYFLDHGEGRLRRMVAERQRLWEKMSQEMELDPEEVERGWAKGEARENVRAIFGWYLVVGKLDDAVAGWMSQRQLEGATEVELPSGKTIKLPPLDEGGGG